MHVLIHREGDYYGLEWAVTSLKRHAPTVPLTVITDSALDAGCRCVNLDTMQAGLGHLDAVYDHLHKRADREFILRGIRRWFVYRNLVEEFHLAGPLYVPDSDVLTFCDPRSQYFEIGADRYDIGACTTAMPGVAIKPFQAPTFISDASLLAHFCAFVLQVYRKENDVLESFGDDPHFAGEVSDMALWTAYYRRNALTVLPLTDIAHNGTTWDHHYELDYHLYEHREGAKNMIFKQGRPWCYNHRYNKWVRFNSLHCTGKLKDKIHEVWDESCKSHDEARKV